jgi:hypothetical protein
MNALAILLDSRKIIQYLRRLFSSEEYFEFTYVVELSYSPSSYFSSVIFMLFCVII